MITGLFATFFYLIFQFYVLLFKAMFFMLKLAFAGVVGAAQLLVCAGSVVYHKLSTKSVEAKRHGYIASKTMISLTDGYEFEEYVAHLMKKSGFHRVKITPKSGDYGVDVLARKEGKKYAIQCKLYKSPVGPKAVQEIYAGGRYYNCDICVVATNNYYTLSALSLAEKTGVVLWDGAALSEMERLAG